MAALAPHCGTLHRPSPTEEFVNTFPHLARVYIQVTKITKLNIDNWRELLKNYADSSLANHLAFGFPLGFVTHDKPHTQAGNHASTRADVTAVDHYLATEIAHQAIAGSFKDPPFSPWFHMSPMML